MSFLTKTDVFFCIYVTIPWTKNSFSKAISFQGSKTPSPFSSTWNFSWIGTQYACSEIGGYRRQQRGLGGSGVAREGAGRNQVTPARRVTPRGSVDRGWERFTPEAAASHNMLANVDIQISAVCNRLSIATILICLTNLHWVQRDLLNL